jgi:endonuclease YncB( thermonuclease family)
MGSLMTTHPGFVPSARDYVYRVVGVRKVVDGDTYDLVLDLGLYLQTTQRVRLLGVNAPEARTPDGPAATAFAAEWLAAHLPDLHCQTFKSDSFGRWLGIVTAGDGTVDLATSMLAAGVAVPYRP